MVSPPSALPFEPPDFAAPIDIDAQLQACPAIATARGTFFQYVSDLALKQTGTLPPGLFEGVSARRWTAWNTYPLTDFMRLAVNAARLAFPREPLREGLRRVGWTAYPSFASTMAGRVVVFAFGDDIDAMLQAIPRAYSVSLRGAEARSRRVGPGHWEVELRGVHNFADCYQVGVLEGAVRARGGSPRIRIRRLPRPSDLDLEVRW